MDEEISDEEYEDDNFNPYIFERCKYGCYINAGNYCCRRCANEKAEIRASEFSKRFWRNYFNELFGNEISNNYEDIYYHFNILNINRDNFLNLNNDRQKKILKKQYHKLARKLHPDKGGCKDKFNQIKASYDFLLYSH